jgi:cell division protein FtsB
MRRVKIKEILINIIVAAALISIFFPGFARLQQLKEQNRELEKEMLGLKVANDELERRIYKLETDPVYLENVARQKLKKSLPGEIVYKAR